MLLFTKKATSSRIIGLIMPQGDVFSHGWRRGSRILFNLKNLPNLLNRPLAI